MFCASDIIMHDVFNSSCENKINLIISYKHNFTYMLDIQSFPRRATGQLLARWLNITPFILQEVFPCVNYHIEEKKIYSVVSNEGKRRVIFQNEWNKGNVHKDLKLVGSMGTKKCKIQKANIILVFFLNYFIIWLQQNTRSDWLFSCDDWALQARSPRHYNLYLTW